MKKLLFVAAAGLLLAGCTDNAPPPAPVPPVLSAAPVAKGATAFGAHWDWNRYEQVEPYLRKLSGSSTFLEFSWCDVEKTQGSPDFSAVDQAAERSRALGIRLDLKIRVGVCWATGGTAKFTRGQANKTESAMPLDMAAYQAFVTTVVKRYQPQGVSQYAIENEVNAQQYWAGTPEDYETLVRAAAEAIHAADPAAEVVDSGISSVAMGMGVAGRLADAGQADAAVAAYNAYFPRRVGTRGKQIPAVTDAAGLQTALAQQTNVRNRAFLAATERLLDDGVVTVRQLHFYEHPDGIPALLDYLKAETPAGVPIQAWEVGRFDKTVATDQAAISAEMTEVVSLLLAGGVTEVVWLPLAYNPDNRAGAEVRTGLLGPDGAERPAGTMFAGLAAAAKGAKASPVTTGDLTGVAFSGPAGTRLVVWSKSGATVTVPAKANLKAATTPAPGTPLLIETDKPLPEALAAIAGR